MKRILRSKPILSLAAIVMIAAAVVIPLSSSITRSHAQGTGTVTFTKAATPKVAPGGMISYTLTLTNTSPIGSGNLHDIHLTDAPPPQTSGTFTTPTFTITPTGSASVDCKSSTASSISCFVDDFNPGSVVTVTFTTTASSTATGTIINTATAQSFDIGTMSASAKTVVTAPTPSPIEKLCDKFGGFVEGICDNVAKTIGAIGNDTCEMPNSAACKALEVRVGKAFCSIGAAPGSCTPEIEEEVGHILIGEAKCDLGLDLLKKVPFVGAILNLSLEAVEPLVCPIIGAIKDVSE